MPDSLNSQTFTGPHPTNRDLIAQLAAWGFTVRKEDGVHTLYRGPHGGTLRVLRSGLGRVDPDLAAKAERLARMTAQEFWAGPGPVPQPRSSAPSRPPATRDTAVSLVLAVHVDADRPLGFDQVVELSTGSVTRDQARTACAALCRDGQLDRIRSGVYQWSGGRRSAQPAAAPATGEQASAAPGEGGRVVDLFAHLLPADVTPELLADLEQWARLTGKLARHRAS